MLLCTSQWRGTATHIVASSVLSVYGCTITLDRYRKQQNFTFLYSDIKPWPYIHTSLSVLKNEWNSYKGNAIIHQYSLAIYMVYTQFFRRLHSLDKQQLTCCGKSNHNCYSRKVEWLSFTCRLVICIASCMHTNYIQISMSQFTLVNFYAFILSVKSMHHTVIIIQALWLYSGTSYLGSLVPTTIIVNVCN